MKEKIPHDRISIDNPTFLDPVLDFIELRCISIAFLVYPIVLSEPRNKTVLGNEDVRFDCQVDGRPGPKTSWSCKNNSSCVAAYSGAQVLSNGSLVIPSVKNNDHYEGRYVCFGENAAGKTEKSVRYLTVHGKCFGKK